jgi:Ankyrin repeats (many copies)
MGNCCTTKKYANFEKFVASKMIEAIEKNAADKIKELIIKYTNTIVNKEPILNINQPIVKIYSQDMNALGYALFLGYTESFSVILELGKAKLSSMSKLYANLSKRPIDIICELGHKSLLEFYLPFYLGKSDEIEEVDSDSISLSISRSKVTKSHINEKSKSLTPMSTLPPLHRACEKGRVNIVQYLWDYFKNKTIPLDFDFYHQDEYTGDNSALVACKTGNLELIKFLNETCRVDFRIFNKRKESSIQVLAVWSKKKKQKKFIDCFKYLIEVVGVDYTYEFEETLLVLEDKSIIAYLEEKLKFDGISISKSRVDDKYSISRNRVPVSMDPVLEIKLSKIRGSKFSFKELFKEELEESKVELSSISEKSVQSVSNITFLDAHN